MCRLVETLPRLSLLQPKISAAVDHQSVGMQLRSNLARRSMRQRKENHIMICEHIGGGLVDKSFQQRNQMWLVLTEESSGVAARSYRADFHIGMRKQQPE